ncbi:MAG: hypothetical protein GX221_09330 [Candidatus Riflebacteria bacterium]|nr:hypothetical protein [Candidatus Riflebacteria bacterium]
MKNISSSFLPFKLASTEEKISSYSGLALLGEFLYGIGVPSLLDSEIADFKSSRGYKASDFILPLTLMLNGGGRYIEDI